MIQIGTQTFLQHQHMRQRQGTIFLSLEQAKLVTDVVFLVMQQQTLSMDMGFLTSENQLTMTVDKSKLARWRKAGRIQTQTKQIPDIGSKPVTGFYFDGKKDSTLTKVH